MVPSADIKNFRHRADLWDEHPPHKGLLYIPYAIIRVASQKEYDAGLEDLVDYFLNAYGDEEEDDKSRQVNLDKVDDAFSVSFHHIMFS